MANQIKPALDTFGMAERMRAFQVFSNKVNALAQEEKKSDKTVERLVALANELAAEYPCGRFPATLLDSQGKALTLKEQNNVYSNLFQSVSKKSPTAPEDSSPEAMGGLSFLDVCFIEYYQYTHHRTDLGQAIPHYVIISEIGLHMSIMQQATGSQGYCSYADRYQAMHVATIPASPFE